MNQASLANTTKGNNSNYKAKSISKAILFYCKTGLYSRNRGKEKLLVCYEMERYSTSNAQFRRRTSHVPYQVVRSFLAVVRCPNEFFFRQISVRQAKISGYDKAWRLIRPSSENVFGTAHERYGV